MLGSGVRNFGAEALYVGLQMQLSLAERAFFAERLGCHVLTQVILVVVVNTEAG